VVRARNAKPQKKVASEKTDGSYIWDAYAAAYEGRYKIAPKRNSKNNTHCKRIAELVGKEDGIKVASYYLTHNDSWYVKTTHALEYLAKNCEGLVTQMATGNRVTSSSAHQADKSQANQQVFENAFAKLRDKQVIKAVDVGDA
jgi:hypothetical protein